MMRSLYSGVSGLRTHQIKMDVIGNNIANVNTTAYKSSSMTFRDLMSQTTQRASGPSIENGTGGVNARQIGLGVRSASINLNIEGQGASQSTGNPFDVMITGSAFFIVSNGVENFFTRDGSFYIDGGGNLAMTSTGFNVMGWQVDEETGMITRDNVSALRIMSNANLTYPPEATTAATIAGIIDKFDKQVTSSTGRLINLNFFDAMGYNYTAKFAIKQSADPNEYSVELVSLQDPLGGYVPIENAVFDAMRTQLNPGTVTLDTSAFTWASNTQLTDRETPTPNLLADIAQMIETVGTETRFKANTELITVAAGPPPTQITVGEALNNIAKAHGYEGSVDEFLSLCQINNATTPPTITTIRQMLIAGNLPTMTIAPAPITEFNVDGRRFQGTLLNYNPNNGNFAGIAGLITNLTATLDLTAVGPNFRNIVIDFSETSMINNNGTSSVSAERGDLLGLNTGRRTGDMSDIMIQKDGMIFASYDNGMTRLLGQIAVAEFANASGLEKQGDNLYSSTLNSGEFDGIGDDITENGGYMSSGQLEMSNVDLSMEFTEMITTQRGFQANSRIITVSDSLLEELTNLKR